MYILLNNKINMYKTIASLFAVALIAGSGLVSAQGTTTSSSSDQMKRAPVNASCIQLAVDVREGAIGSAFSQFTTSINSALSARKIALNAAWGMQDAKMRRAARNAAWDNFQIASKSAHSVLKTARKAAWATFKAASSACGLPVVENERGEGHGTLGL
jgi:hypothetical protein